MIPTPIKNYVIALEANDLALASKAWRAAQVPGKEEEKQAMIKEMDFRWWKTFRWRKRWATSPPCPPSGPWRSMLPMQGYPNSF